MIILAIDPGPEKSAWLGYDSERDGPGDFGISDNLELVASFDYLSRVFAKVVCPDIVVIENIQCFGMPVGQAVFDTMFWVGRFVEGWGGPYELINRTEVKIHLCHTHRAKNANIRAALIDRFGGSKEAAIGTKKKPGPLHGVKTHIWSALALAVTYADSVAEKSDADF